MKLSKILKGVKCTIYGNKNINVLGITDIEIDVVKGGCFVAICGQRTDGHTLASKAVLRGASVLVVERQLFNIDKNITQVVVKNTREVIGVLAANFNGNPSKKMKMIAITGTNGKTSTTYIIKHLLESCGIKTGVIGTSGYAWGDNVLPSNLTTPDPIALQQMLSVMQKDKVQAVAMEVSAHALDLYKTNGIVFDIAIFTNITQDHLDYFKNMQNYKDTKAKLFNKQNSKLGIICTDDQFGNWLYNNAKIPTISFGKRDADYCALAVEPIEKGLQFYVQTNSETQKFLVPLYGEFNCLNTLGAVAAVEALGISLQQSAEALKSLSKIDGRFNVYHASCGTMVVIDYAHTPDGVENVLKTARDIAKERGGRVISVFGCGGNRDRLKRPIMGKISASIADISIVTSDNPRLEDPQEIINDVISEMDKKSYIAIVDRKKAILKAINISKEKDIVIILGKGAENYIDIGGKKLPYSDEETVLALLKK